GGRAVPVVLAPGSETEPGNKEQSGRGGEETHAAGQPLAEPGLAVVAQALEEPLVQPLRHGHVADGPAEMGVELALGAVQGAAVEALVEVDVERVLVLLLQLRRARPGKVDQVSGVSTIHRSPSGGSGPAPAPPGPAAGGASATRPWPEPDAT